MTATHAQARGLDSKALALLVDHDADTRKMYAEFLQMAEVCDVDEAEDGREALAKAIARRPDVIVTETRLPGLSGFDLCALLRRDTTTSKIPIIFVTGDAYESDLKRAQRAGADVVLTKPCLPDRLLDEMRRQLAYSVELRERGGAVYEPTPGEWARSEALQESPEPTPFNARRIMLSRTHERRDTTEPPIPPPALICPNCDLPLRYLRSHIGGVSVRHPEQWDYFECTAGCGTFQYRERTKKIRKV